MQYNDALMVISYSVFKMERLGKWLYLNNIHEINYGEHIAHRIILSTYAKKKISILFIMLMTMILRIHIDVILNSFINFNQYVDFVIQIVISVSLILCNGYIYQFVDRYNHECYLLTKYLINNYTLDNFRKWKKIVTISICIYILIYLTIFDVNNYNLIL